MVTVGVVVVKKLAGCLVRTVVIFILLAILAALYFFYRSEASA